MRLSRLHIYEAVANLLDKVKPERLSDSPFVCLARPGMCRGINSNQIKSIQSNHAHVGECKFLCTYVCLCMGGWVGWLCGGGVDVWMGRSMGLFV